MIALDSNMHNITKDNINTTAVAIFGGSLCRIKRSTKLKIMITKNKTNKESFFIIN